MTPAKTPNPPYWAVIFTSLRTEGDEGYGAASEEMERLAALQPGYLGIESARTPGGLGITVSYWESEAGIATWRRQTDHLGAQRLGRERWYSSFTVRGCKVERASEFPSP